MLIIFDCDGVLVDSETLAADVFSSALQSINITMAAQECLSTFHGLTLNDCYAWLEKNKNCVLPADFPQFLESETRTRFDKDLQAVAGIESVLRVLSQNGVRRCVASNGSKKKIKNSLRATGLLDYFDDFFSAEEVPRGKPDPALFHYASSKMGVSASQTLVIEDSYAGYQAATAANMKTILYRPAFIYDAERAEHITEMSELLTLLNKRFINKIRVATQQN